MSKLNDDDLKKAALVIAKLLIRTREGKIQWVKDEASLVTLIGSMERYKASLEDQIEASIYNTAGKLGFKVSAPPLSPKPSRQRSVFVDVDDNEVLSVELDSTHDREAQRTPESILYRDMKELFALAKRPKSASDDLRLKQLMNYLDKL